MYPAYKNAITRAGRGLWWPTGLLLSLAIENIAHCYNLNISVVKDLRNYEVGF